MKASIYIHLPFCARKCAYCDFESYAGRLGSVDMYISRLLDEAKKYSVSGVPTVYLGGGTPSLLNAEQLKRLLGGVFDMMPPDMDAEISMEANPGTVSAEKLRTARELGVNRISFGVQAVQKKLLDTLERIHDYNQAAEAVALAHEAGIHNINCDVMYGLPGQTVSDLIETADRLISLGITHISCYSLILEEGTRLFERVSAGELTPADDDEVCDMQDALLGILRGHGFERYEISNYALPGCECRHNIVYWQGGNYLGLGCAAHSFIDGERFNNPDFDAYMSGREHENSTVIDEAERLYERIMLETRMTKGVNLADFPPETARRLMDEARRPMYKGLAEIADGYLRFTDQGLMVQNALVVNFAEML